MQKCRPRLGRVGISRSREFTCARKHFWIPAFAGMTGLESEIGGVKSGMTARQSNQQSEASARKAALASVTRILTFSHQGRRDLSLEIRP